jgi:threonine/homoserine/homoserine lactone efflux protein
MFFILSLVLALICFVRPQYKTSHSIYHILVTGHSILGFIVSFILFGMAADASAWDQSMSTFSFVMAIVFIVFIIRGFIHFLKFWVALTRGD